MQFYGGRATRTNYDNLVADNWSDHVLEILYKVLDHVDAKEARCYSDL